MDHNYGYANVLKHLDKIMEESCPKDWASSLYDSIYNEASKAYEVIENEIAKQTEAEISKLEKSNITKVRRKIINDMLKALLKNNVGVYPPQSVSRMSTPWFDNEGRACATDGYRAFRFNLGVYLIVGEISPDADPKMFDRLWDHLSEKCTERLELPDRASLKKHIVIECATRLGFPIYRFPMVSCATSVNAEYLLDLMLVFPDVCNLYREPGNPHSPLLARSADGDAVLLPVAMKEQEE